MDLQVVGSAVVGRVVEISGLRFLFPAKILLVDLKPVSEDLFLLVTDALMLAQMMVQA